MTEYIYAAHNFQPQYEDELAFHKGERIEVLEKDELYEDGWWKGRNQRGEEGIFPGSYTSPDVVFGDLFPDRSNLDQVDDSARSTTELKLNPEHVYAFHDFQPEHGDEIAFRVGEHIEVLEKDGRYGDGWWQGRNIKGKVGLFPMSYTSTMLSGSQCGPSAAYLDASSPLDVPVDPSTLAQARAHAPAAPMSSHTVYVDAKPDDGEFGHEWGGKEGVLVDLSSDTANTPYMYIRPTFWGPSPSTGSLTKSAAKSSRSGSDSDEDEDERCHMKEKDMLSWDSASIDSHHADAKKSVDGVVKHGRLGIFGGTFGKRRKLLLSANKVLSEKASSSNFTLPGPLKQGQNVLEQIGEPDHVGWMRKKGGRYNTWKLRYFILKGPYLYWLSSNDKNETKIKGCIHIVGYKITVDANVDPGRYGFRIDHEHDKTHLFSSEERTVIKDWMKAIMKLTIGRDYTKPVISSCNIPTIPLTVAQAMNPAPRPPSPTARDAMQKALRREYPDKLSSRDAKVLMGLPGSDGKDERARLDSFFSDDGMPAKGNMTPTPRRATTPPRPSKEMRRSASQKTASNAAEDNLIEWANSHLPESLQITDPTGPLCGLALLRLAESIKGRPSSPPVSDSAVPADPNDDKVDGLLRLFDFLLDNDVEMGSVRINDVRQGKRDEIVQLLRALKTWEEKEEVVG